MIRVRDYAVDTFEAALEMLCSLYVGAGLTKAEARDALARRLRALERAAPHAAAANDQAEGGGDAGAH